MDTFNRLTRIFQIFGILPTTLLSQPNVSKKYNQILELWNISVLLFTVALTIAILHYRDQVMLIGIEIGTFNVFIKFMTVVVAGYVTLLESLCRREHIQNFYEKLELLGTEFQRRGMDIKNRLTMDRKKYFYWFIFLKTLTLFKSMMDFIVFKDESMNTVYYASSTILSYGICQVKSFQMCSALVDMVSLVKEFNNGLRFVIIESSELCTRLNDEGFQKRYKKFTDSILFFKLKHLDLKLLSCEINSFFGWSITFYFIQVFVITTSDLYWIYYVKIITPGFKTPLQLLPVSINQVALALTVLVVVTAAEKYYNEANVSLALLHQIKRHKDDLILNDLLLNFSLQFRYAKVEFTAHDFFKLSHSLVGSVSTRNRLSVNSFYVNIRFQFVGLRRYCSILGYIYSVFLI